MINNSTLFTSFIENLVKNPSPKIQKNFMDISSKIAETIRRICDEEGLIFNVSYESKNYWSEGKNYEACFVDGGVYSGFVSSSAPFAIRAKSYIVKPSKSLLERERFEESMAYMGDLYDSKNNIYDLTEDPYEDNKLLHKKKDAARIMFETAAIVKHVFEKKKFDYCFLHGPIQTPIMPFSGPEFPLFKKEVVKNILPFFKFDESKETDRHFINTYFNALNYLSKAKFPIYGVVERTTSTIYLRNLLYRAVKKGKIAENDYDKIISTIKRYKITDGNLFELILSDCQALKPLEVEKQIPSKAWGEWEVQMNSFPKAYVGYLKTNEHQSPIRIESLQNPIKIKKDYEYILATSKLLPNYGYPVGLDIVDRAAKIPAWLGRAAKEHYSKYYLDLAIEKNDKKTISSALNMLQGGRFWTKRPKAGKVGR